MRLRMLTIPVGLLAVTFAILAVCLPTFGGQGLAVTGEPYVDVVPDSSIRGGILFAGESPLLPPQIYGPEDFSYFLGSSGNVVEWAVNDTAPFVYEIYIDGPMVTYGSSEVNTTIQVDVDDLVIGTHECVIIASGNGGESSDVVMITVIPYPSTTVSSPSDIAVFEGAAAFTISWDIYSDYPVSYEVYLDGQLILSNLWFSNYETVEIRVEGLAAGQYDYMVIAIGQDNEAGDTVHVSVIRVAVPPQISGSPDFSLQYGDFGTIYWNLYDAYPAYYVITLDGQDIRTETWSTANESVKVKVAGLSAGVHDYSITAVNKAGLMTTDHIEVTVLMKTINKVTITYTGDVSGTYSDPVSLSATLVESITGYPMAERELLFMIGSQSAVGTTDANGLANVSLVITQPAGMVEVVVEFAGDEEYLTSTTTALFQIEREQVVVQYTGATVVSTGSDCVELKATLYEQMDDSLGNLTLAYVTFLLYDGPADSNPPILVVSSVPVLETGIPGIGFACIEIADLPAGQYFILVSLDSSENLYYQGPVSESVTLTVSEPTNRFITGSGWVIDPSGKKAHFTFMVKYGRDGSLKGHFIYTYTDGKHTYSIVSTVITGMAIDGKHAFFEGYCEILEYVHCGRHPVTVMENLRFRVDVWDSRSRCAPDVFQIRVSDEFGLVVHEAGVDPLGRVYCGGIQIHTRHHAHRGHMGHH